MKYTTNLQLKKPDYVDPADIGILNENMDIVDAELKKVNEQLGDMTQVPTTSKTASGAITELFTNVSDGKSLIGGAITGVDDSVVIPTDASFGDLASAIGQISTGKKWASGSVVSSQYKENFINQKGDSVSWCSVTVNGLSFKPSLILLSFPDNLDKMTIYKKDFFYMSSQIYGEIKTSSSSSVYYLRLDGDKAYVNENGFKLPVALWSKTEFNWIAFE